MAAACRASVDRDIACLTRMYAWHCGETGTGASIEDVINCPFRELALVDGSLHAGGRDRQWRFCPPAPGAIPGAVVAWACLDYACRAAPGAASVSLDRLAHEPGSPGRAFLLDRETLTGLLEQAAAAHPAVSIARSAAGLDLLAFTSDPAAAALDIVDAHYQGARDRVATPQQWAARFPAPVQAALPPRRPPRPPARLRGHSPGQGALFDVPARRGRLDTMTSEQHPIAGPAGVTRRA